MLSPTLSKSLACCIVALLAASAPANTVFGASLNGANPPNEIDFLRAFEARQALKRYGDEPERRGNLEEGLAHANIHDATLRSSEIPVGLSVVFLIVGFVCGFTLRAAISQFRRAKTGGDSHITHWDVSSESFSPIPTASAAPAPPRYGPSSRKSPQLQNYAN